MPQTNVTNNNLFILPLPPSNLQGHSTYTEVANYRQMHRRNTPDDATFRIRLLFKSTTYTAPLESTDTPINVSNFAVAAEPSAQPAVPDPAKVDTTPAQTKNPSNGYLQHSNAADQQN